MDRRFVCRECGTKWFIHEHRIEEPDLTECGGCGGSLVKLDATTASGGYGSLPGEREGGVGEDP
jgi:hypothetical protein